MGRLGDNHLLENWTFMSAGLPLLQGFLQGFLPPASMDPRHTLRQGITAGFELLITLLSRL